MREVSRFRIYKCVLEILNLYFIVCLFLEPVYSSLNNISNPFYWPTVRTDYIQGKYTEDR